MATNLPIPIEFSLPAGWRPAPPDEVGAPQAAFVALHPRPDDGFTANITISGEFRPDAASLEAIADDALERVRAFATNVEVSKRKALGTESSPGFAQSVSMTVDVKGRTRDLVQRQLFMAYVDAEDSRKRVVLQLTLTATPGQLDEATTDFHAFIATVQPDRS
ncbi:hypothetical protein [Stackebrandtia nassauensis]|uniref:DUF1795 domain-containing protein n=1 Tax=Stackebrandtia nassauensis (strain DSM 44728 / CIP 108903 / NRRL B-16338 / NBRC 102104 / LLR-40K-21) TaxID=446470 RepID=D3Q6Y3_STANL|nr:hypothetical protein [Stackebrandtia nassauensis]ADD40382.1 hypothetical protein Snas_0669 [Stackebrandtia nassauensis DSM 44728]